MEIESKENFEPIKKLVVKSLEEAFKVHESLGARGEELLEKNQFGETALRVDIEIEKVILDFLRERNFPIRVISEEHGVTEIGNNPQYLSVLDGLDGSSVYRKGRGRGRYGTMFGIFNSTDPTYDDYIASGIMEHSTGLLFIASKNSGASIILNGKTTPIHTDARTELDPNMIINIDEYFDLNIKTFTENLQGLRTQCLKASSAHYMSVANGEAGLALECTRKGNLEIASAYGLIKEAGGVIVDMEGNSIGDKKFLLFGQKEKLPIITAANNKLAQALLNHIKK
jgi:fructose-1,6-bisphosphatase/inositol monophosphatase family enzyme